MLRLIYLDFCINTSKFEEVGEIDHIEVYVNNDLLSTGLIMVDNVIGGIMMGGSTFFFFKEEERKKNELKLLVEKLSGKEEHENEINVLNAIEKVLQENRETLRTIDENHEKIIAGVCDNSEIKDSITAINELLKDCFDSLEKQVVIQDSKTSVERNNKEIRKIITTYMLKD